MTASTSPAADALSDCPLLFAAGRHVHAGKWSGITAAMHAALLGHDQCLRGLVASGADVDAREDDGATAAMLAAQFGHASCLRILIFAGSDLTAEDGEGRTALIWAAQRGARDCLSALMAAGVRFDQKSSKGATAAEQAVIYGHPEIGAWLRAVASSQYERGALTEALAPVDSAFRTPRL